MDEIGCAARAALDALPRGGRISVNYETRTILLHVHQDTHGWFWVAHDKAHPMWSASGLTSTLEEAVRQGSEAAGLSPRLATAAE
jgi:hypothetical protein